MENFEQLPSVFSYQGSDRKLVSHDLENQIINRKKSLISALWDDYSVACLLFLEYTYCSS
jgi:hypothetical protein